MTSKKTITLALLFALLSSSFSKMIFADDDEGGSAKIGPDQAITKSDHDQGIQLSELAIKRIGIKSKVLPIQQPLSIPKSALVYFQDQVGVYRVRDSWFKLVEVKVLSKTSSEARIKSDDLASKDQIVIQGTPLLRVAHLEASEGEESGHDD